MNVTTNSATPSRDTAHAHVPGKLSTLQQVLVLLCFLVVVLDGLDTVATGFVAPSIAHDFTAPYATLGPLLSMALFGMTAGALIAGPLADRIGRKPVLIGSVILFGACTIACSTVPSILALTVLRLFTGFGLGGAMPTAGTLLSEYVPPSRRAFFTNLMYCGFPLGASLGGFLAAAIIPHWGWRGVFFAGGAAPLALSLGLFAMPESVRFMRARNWPAEKLAHVLSRLPKGIVDASAHTIAPTGSDRHAGGFRMIMSRQFAPGTVMLWIGYFIGLLVFYLQASWLPTLLQHARFGSRQSASIAALLPFGGVLGTIVCGWLLDRLRPFRVVAWTFALGAASLFIASHSLASTMLLSAAIFAAGIFLVGAQSSMLSLAIGFYPTVCRATGTAWMLGVGRVGGIVGTLAGGYLLREGLEVQTTMGLLAPATLAAAGAVAICEIVTRHTADRPMQ